MVSRPLADQFCDRSRVRNFIRRSTGEMVGCDVADAVPAGLDGVHLHLCQGVQNVGYFTQLGPVELDVLAGGEMAVAFVELVGNVGQLVHLAAT